MSYRSLMEWKKPDDFNQNIFISSVSFLEVKLYGPFAKQQQHLKAMDSSDIVKLQ